MKKVLRFLIIGVINYQLSTINCFSATIDRVIAVVNGETITQGELDAASLPMLEKLKTKFKGEELTKEAENGKKEILNKMVDEKLILSEAKKKQIEVGDSEIEERLKEAKAIFESEEMFDEALNEGGVSLSELKQRYADQLMVAKLVELEVRKKIVVNPSEVLAYYNLHEEDFRQPQLVRLRNILIKPGADLADEDARVLAEKILDSLKAGEDFKELALKYSKGPNADRGGELGFVKKGQMLEDIEEAVFELETGVLSDVIKTELGYHIFKVEEKKPERLREFNEVKDEIEKIIFLENGKQRYKEWIEALKKNAYISFR